MRNEAGIRGLSESSVKVKVPGVCTKDRIIHKVYNCSALSGHYLVFLISFVVNSDIYKSIWINI